MLRSHKEGSSETCISVMPESQVKNERAGNM